MFATVTPTTDRTPQPAADRAARELCGVVSKIIFHDLANGHGHGHGNGGFIAALHNGHVVTGEVQDGEIEPHTRYRFMGRWVEKPRYGWQFTFDSFVLDTPVDRQGVIAYLCRECSEYMTQAVARKLCDSYGAPALLEILRTDMARVVADGHITPWKGAELSRKLVALAAFEKTTVDLFALFAGRGFPRGTIKAAIAKWGAAAADTIKRSPYSMLTAELPGVGFKRADKLYVELGRNPHALKRQMFAAWDALRQDADGHTWTVEGAARSAIVKCVGMAQARFDAAIAMGIRIGWLAAHKDAAGRLFIAERQKAADETTVAMELIRLMRCPVRLWPSANDIAGVTEIDLCKFSPGDRHGLRGPDGEPGNECEYCDAIVMPNERLKGNPLSFHQRDKLNSILKSSVAILGGTPGTGKTFSAAWVLGHVIKRVGRDRVKVCAPTGKAAVRITEALSTYNLGLEATTIHRLLEIGRNGHDGRGWGFVRCRENPLDASVVVVDETSMVSTDLMAALLSACGDGCHVLLVGDPYQLAPVGHGKPLLDMIEAGVPSAVLTEIKRNAGLIVTACSAIKDGKRFRTADKYNPETGDNLRWIEADTPAAALAALERIITAVKGGGKFDPVWETQVLCALNEKSPVSRVPLNDMLLGLLNPPTAGVGDSSDDPEKASPFRLGDKIICLKNSLMPIWELVDESNPTAVTSWAKPIDHTGGAAPMPMDSFVANGDVGRVLAVDGSACVVRFLWPDRVVKLELRRPKRDDPTNEGKEGGAIGDFALAYALTVHKSQGSEYKLVIVMVDDQASAVASREHHYTACSRAKDLCIFIGRRATLDRQCRRVSLQARRTFLAETIRELQKGGPTP